MTTNDLISTTFADRRAFEDAEQARILSQQVIVLQHDNWGQVVAGPFKGQSLNVVVPEIITGHLRAGMQVAARCTTLYPWWRFWRPTRTIRITVQS